MKNYVILFLFVFVIGITFFSRATTKNYETRIMLWKMAYEREQAEVIRQQQVMISFGIPVFVIDPNNPLKVIPVDK